MKKSRFSSLSVSRHCPPSACFSLGERLLREPALRRLERGGCFFSSRLDSGDREGLTSSPRRWYARTATGAHWPHSAPEFLFKFFGHTKKSDLLVSVDNGEERERARGAGPRGSSSGEIRRGMRKKLGSETEEEEGTRKDGGEGGNGALCWLTLSLSLSISLSFSRSCKYVRV